MAHAVAPSNRTKTPAQTAWVTVLLAVSAGMLAAFQVGKVHIALLSIRQSFALSLFSASWILSSLNILGALMATPAGTWSARFGNKQSVIVGLVLIAVASAGGGMSPTVSLLLLSRLIEGIGFVLVVVAAPSLIVEVTSRNNLRLALSAWSAYVPGGVALVTLMAPFVLKGHTWRALWQANAVLLLLAAGLMAVFSKSGPKLVGDSDRIGTGVQFRQVLFARGPLLLSIIFGLYTLQHLSVMGFMPTLLHERYAIPDARIGALVGIAMASNILGNLAAGALLQRGFSRSRIIMLTSIFMALTTIGMFLVPLPFSGFYACMFAFSCVGGLIPSSVMGAAPFHTPTPALLGATNGLLVQGSNLGIVVGPPVMSLIATRLGWSWVPVMTCAAALLAALLANSMRATTHSNADLEPAPTH